MAWSVPCPDCETPNEPDGSGAALCSACGRFYAVPAAGSRARDLQATAVRISLPLLEIEEQLHRMGIPFERTSDSALKLIRQIGPQTVSLTIDATRTIHLSTATGVANLNMVDSAGSTMFFDPRWKERFDFDLSLEDKTFQLINALETGDPPALPVPPEFPFDAAPNSPPPIPTPTPVPTVIVEPPRLELPPPPPPEALIRTSPPLPPSASMNEALEAAAARRRSGPREVIVPSTPDGKPPVLQPTEAPPKPPPAAAVPFQPPKALEGVHIGNGASRDVIDPNVFNPAVLFDEDSSPGLLLKAAMDEVPDATTPYAPVIPPAPITPSGALVDPSSRVTVIEKVAAPVASLSKTTLNPGAPVARSMRARRSGSFWVWFLGAVIGALVATYVEAPPQLTVFLPPTAVSEVRDGTRAARSGDLPRALMHYQKAVELDPRCPEAWRNLGATYALSGDAVKSAEAYRKYVEVEPDAEKSRPVGALLEKK